MLGGKQRQFHELYHHRQKCDWCHVPSEGLGRGSIKKAVELMGDGHVEVQITASDGRVYSHAEFDQLCVATRT